MLIPKKYHIHIVALIALAIIVIYPRLAQRVDPQIIKNGTVAAEVFLQLVDDKKYDQSWTDSSTLMQEKIVPEVWSHQIVAMRDRVGQLISREQTKSSLSDWAKNAPDGQYLTLTYTSSFTKEREALETIILTLDKDEQWRVAGYFIK